MAESSPNKKLATSNFSFSHSVFKRLLLQTRKNQGLFGKGLSHIQLNRHVENSRKSFGLCQPVHSTLSSIHRACLISFLSVLQEAWRKVVSTAVLLGIPTPAFSTALAFFDGYRSERLPANLLQVTSTLYSEFLTFFCPH